jgi:REP element-mobilizing transposase RayT
MPADPLEPDYLRRLDAGAYRGDAYVHWSMTMDERKQGWLNEVFHHRFREVLTHTMFRYGLICPIYCCMPDHLHLLWMGLFDGSDQRNAAKFFRAQLNPILEEVGARFQHQPYDRVLRDEDRQETAFENVVEYIARNPERAGLVLPVDAFRKYPYTGCLVPGYPNLKLWQADFWDLFWRIHSRLRAEGLMRDVRRATGSP